MSEKELLDKKAVRKFANGEKVYRLLVNDKRYQYWKFCEPICKWICIYDEWVSVETYMAIIQDLNDFKREAHITALR